MQRLLPPDGSDRHGHAFWFAQGTMHRCPSTGMPIPFPPNVSPRPQAQAGSLLVAAGPLPGLHKGG